MLLSFPLFLEYAKIFSMEKMKKQTMKCIKRSLIALLLVVGVVCFFYAFALYFSGFGGFLSYVWLLPAFLCFLFSGMLSGKIALKKWQKRIMLYILVPIVVIFLIVEMIILSGFFEKPKEEPEYIVVLGTTVYDHGPCYLLRQRLKEAAKWAEEYENAKIVVTGGQGESEPFTEGSEMKRYLIEELSIDADRIIVEEKSTNTYENMVFSGEILDAEYEDFSYENSSMLVITNNFHMYRALKIAKKAGFERVCGAPSGTYIFLFPHFMVREFFSIVKNLVLGRM